MIDVAQQQQQNMPFNVEISKIYSAKFLDPCWIFFKFSVIVIQENINIWWTFYILSELHISIHAKPSGGLFHENGKEENCS